MSSNSALKRHASLHDAAPGKAARRKRPAPALAITLALALATCALGAPVAFAQTNFVTNLFGKTDSDADETKDEAQIDEAMDRAIRNRAAVARWRNPATGHFGHIKITGAFRDRENGLDCLHFVRETVFPKKQVSYKGQVCKEFFGWAKSKERRTSVREGAPTGKDSASTPKTGGGDAGQARAPDAVVLEIQTLLRELGYQPGPADGLFGRRTRQAIQEFERDNEKPIVGRATSEVLALAKAKAAEKKAAVANSARTPTTPADQPPTEDAAPTEPNPNAAKDDAPKGDAVAESEQDPRAVQTADLPPQAAAETAQTPAPSASPASDETPATPPAPKPSPAEAAHASQSADTESVDTKPAVGKTPAPKNDVPEESPAKGAEKESEAIAHSQPAPPDAVAKAPAPPERLRGESALARLRTEKACDLCDLIGADLKGLDLNKATLKGALLIGADLTGAQAKFATFDDANLSGARLDGAILWKSSFERALLTGAGLRDAQPIAASFAGADLSGAALEKADLREAQMPGAKLINTNLSNANLRRANFQGSDLTDANLQGADMNDANLANATLTGADFTDADLVGTGVTAADLAHAGTCRTKTDAGALDANCP